MLGRLPRGFVSRNDERMRDVRLESHLQLNMLESQMQIMFVIDKKLGLLFYHVL